jgi:hypothetical protein
MAIPFTTLHYEFRKKANRINSDYAKAISVPDVDAYLNEAKDLMYEKYAALFEINPTIKAHLIQLEVKDYCVSPILVNDEKVFIPYPKDLYRAVRRTLKATTNDCSQLRELIVRSVTSDKESDSLKDPYWNASWDWEETLGIEGMYNNEKGLFVYHQKDFKIDTICVDYLKYLPDGAAPSLALNGSYTSSSGTQVTQDISFLVDSSYLWRKVVDVAVLLFMKNTSEVNDWQAQMQNILGIENLYLKP